MKTARLFINGRSQAVRLPMEFRLPGNEVAIKKVHGIVLLIPAGHPWRNLEWALDQFTDDFMEARDQPAQQLRESL